MWENQNIRINDLKIYKESIIRETETLQQEFIERMKNRKAKLNEICNSFNSLQQIVIYIFNKVG